MLVPSWSSHMNPMSVRHRSVCVMLIKEHMLVKGVMHVKGHASVKVVILVKGHASVKVIQAYKVIQAR